MAKLLDVIVEQKDGSFIVTPVWFDVDRPYTSSYSVGNNRDIANRFALAIKSNKLWSNPPVVMTDVDGRTYVSAYPNVRMRVLSSDLKKIGF